MPHAVRRADRIICPSIATARNLATYWPFASDKISVIAHGKTEFSKHLIKPSKSTPYFLAVGTIEPRKNYPRLIQAFDQWASANGSHDLVIIGTKAWGWSEVSTALSQCTNRHRIHQIDGVNDNELAGYYHNAAGFIQVSLEEGFGMPVAEARQFGLPQILSDIPVFRELNLTTIAWVNPLATESIQDGLDQLKLMNSTQPENILKPWSSVCSEMLTLFRRLFQNSA